MTKRFMDRLLPILALAAFAGSCSSQKNGNGGAPATYDEAMATGRQALEDGQHLAAADHFKKARELRDTAEARHFEHLARGEAALEKDRLVEALDELERAQAAQADPALEPRIRELSARIESSAPAPRIEIEEPQAGSEVDASPVRIRGRVIPAERTQLRVGGKETAVGTEGVFDAVLDLAAGKNSIPVVAERFGKKTEIAFEITLRPPSPELAGLTPASGSWLSGAQARISGKTTIGARVVLAGVEATVASDGSFQADVPLPEEGKNEIAIEVTSGDGPVTTRSIILYRDTTPPILRILEPLPSGLVEGDSVAVEVEVSDQGEIARVLIAEREVPISAGRARVELPLTTDFATIRARVVDRAGHEAAAEVYVMKRPVPPGWTYRGKNSRGHHEVENPADGSVFVWIVPGPFDRGTDDGDEIESPRKKIEISGYFIGKYEVTWDQYFRYCRDKGKILPDRPSWIRDDHPAVNVSWDDAAAYAESVGCRLPTEAEWEKAAGWDDQAGVARRFPWGDAEPEGGGVGLANFSPRPPEADGFAETAPVTECAPGASPYHLFHAGGNVWEWCQDWFDARYYIAARDKDPMGPEEGVERVIRGGAYTSEWAGEMRVASRRGIRPDVHESNVGFRLALSLGGK